MTHEQEQTVDHTFEEWWRQYIELGTPDDSSLFYSLKQSDPEAHPLSRHRMIEMLFAPDLRALPYPTHHPDARNPVRSLVPTFARHEHTWWVSMLDEEAFVEASGVVANHLTRLGADAHSRYLRVEYSYVAAGLLTRLEPDNPLHVSLAHQLLEGMAVFDPYQNPYEYYREENTGLKLAERMLKGKYPTEWQYEFMWKFHKSLDAERQKFGWFGLRSYLGVGHTSAYKKLMTEHPEDFQPDVLSEACAYLLNADNAQPFVDTYHSKSLVLRLHAEALLRFLQRQVSPKDGTLQVRVDDDTVPNLQGLLDSVWLSPDDELYQLITARIDEYQMLVQEWHTQHVVYQQENAARKNMKDAIMAQRK